MTTKKYKFGLIACSSIAARRVIPTLHLANNTELIMAGSRSIDTAKAYAKEHDIPQWGTYEDVINHPEIDVVYISTPPTLHEEWILKAAKNKKHILCEKPMVTSHDSAKRCFKVCDANNVKLLEAYVPMFHPQHQWLKDQLPHYGTPYHIQIHYTSPAPKPGNIRYNPTLNGGVLHDSVGYAINLLLFHFEGTPKLLSATQRQHSKYPVDQAMSLSFEYPNGLIAQAFFGFGLQYRSQYTITCEKGILTPQRAFSINEDVSPKIEMDTDKGISIQTLEPTNQFLTMIDQFCQYLETGKESPQISREKTLTHSQLMDIITTQ